MKSFSKLLLSFLLTAVFTLLGVFLLFPKYLFLEQLLQKNKVFLIAKGVREDINKITFGKGKVFTGNKELFDFDKLVLALVPFGVKADIICKGKHSEVFYFLPGKLKLVFKDFTCFKDFALLRANLEISEGIYGSFYAEGVSNERLRIDKISLNFRGNKFTGAVKYLGMELKGSGSVKLNRNNPLRSHISALFKGKGLSVEILGTPENLSVKLR